MLWRNILFVFVLAAAFILLAFCLFFLLVFLRRFAWLFPFYHVSQIDDGGCTSWWFFARFLTVERLEACLRTVLATQDQPFHPNIIFVFWNLVVLVKAAMDTF